MNIPIQMDCQGSDETKCIVSGTNPEQGNESNMFDELGANQIDWHTTEGLLEDLSYHYKNFNQPMYTLPCSDCNADPCTMFGNEKYKKSSKRVCVR